MRKVRTIAKDHCKFSDGSNTDSGSSFGVEPPTSHSLEIYNQLYFRGHLGTPRSPNRPKSLRIRGQCHTADAFEKPKASAASPNLFPRPFRFPCFRVYLVMFPPCPNNDDHIRLTCWPCGHALSHYLSIPAYE
jgi:hypothetical protein